jgi:hypothetical protein
LGYETSRFAAGFFFEPLSSGCVYHIMKKFYQSVDLTNKVKERLMSLNKVETQEELQQELQLLDEQIEKEKSEERQKTIISWATSLGLHVIVFLMAMSIAFTMAEPEQEVPPTRIVSIPLPPIKTPEEKPKDRELIEKIVIMESETVTDTQPNPITNLEAVDEITSSEDAVETPSDMQKGREEAVSTSEFGGNAFVGVIGVGGPAGGMFGSRTGGGKIRVRAKMGPTGKSAEGATEAGLRWLKKHQSPNGQWSATRYFANCTDGNKCEPGKDESGDEDAAMTGYAVLCFLGQGYDHKTPNKFRPVVKKGLEYLISIQKPDGLIGERNYEHPVATMALVEAYGMTNDPELRKPAQLGVDMILARQSYEKENDPYSGLLWDYTKPNANRNDLSCSGWAIMCLKSAVGAGLNVKDSITGAKKSIERVWKAANPDWDKKLDPYKDTTIFPYTWNANTNVTDKDHLSFVGATCAVFLGHKSGDIMLETLVNDAINRWVTSGRYKQNNYSVYYLSMALFQMGGDRWKLALETLIPYAIQTQRKTEDCFDGSWDYADQQWHGADTGRVLSTCYNILNLQVAYRYAQVNPDFKLPKR